MFFPYRNQNIYYERIGTSKKNIIILPGWGNTRKTFDFLINNLKEKYTIFILDYPSFGNSESLKEDFTIYHYEKMIEEWIKQENIKNPIIIAHSFGGRIVSLLSSKIKIEKLILIDVAGIKRKKIKRILKQTLYKILKKGIKLFPSKKRIKYYFLLKKYFSSSDYNNLPCSMKKTFQNIISIDLKNEYKKITCNTLIIWGKKDNSTPLKDAYLLHRIIKSSELILYDTGHFSYLEKEKEVLKDIILFLKKEDI